MTIWTEAHIKVEMNSTLDYLKNNSSINTSRIYDCIKSDLSKEEDFDYVIGKGGEFFGKKQVSNGNTKVINDSDSEVVFEISFDYIGVSRKDNSSIGDYQKGCIFKFKVDKGKNLITDYIYKQK